MGNLMKGVLLLAPVVIILLIYVLISQGKIDEHMRGQEAHFDRDWHEFTADFGGGTAADRRRAEVRAADAERRIAEAAKAEAQAKGNRPMNPSCEIIADAVEGGSHQ